MRRFLRLAQALLAGALLPATAALADPRSCAQSADVVTAADYLLVDPQNAHRFWRDRYGAEAAYLLVRYGELPPAAALSLVERLAARQRPPERIEELRLVLLPPDRRLSALASGDAALSAAARSSSVQRALILDGEWPRVFADIAARATAPGGTASEETALARALDDVDDLEKLRLAALAEASGLRDLAGTLLASRADLSPWLAHIRRGPQAPTGEAELAALFAPIWFGRLVPGRAPPPRAALPADLAAAADRLEASRQPGSADLDRALALAQIAPATLMLANAINQSGDLRLAGEVAEPLLAAIRAGRQSAADVDGLRAMILERSVAVLGLDQARAVYGGVRRQPDMWTSGSALETLERSLARRALLAFARREGEAPARPQLLSPGFDWAGWRNAAEAIRAGEPAPDSYRGIEAELLHAMGRHGQALRLLRELGPYDENRQRAHGMLATLDQACTGLLSPHPWLGTPVFRFPPRLR
ncbi:hypothetical protein [Phreatobacter oligotrophus]|jgi:hypothetical protein|uniref:Uncharacterized protein n=1 Tax=Phreatobacter oligotrophus TaxID=1122261 RepID=A0A2T4Z283_9HYPH|nr:hypothetical protein [Phreatobacter oligotrophus]PTM54896.1 hypothetical protein C8P69_10546 [Phreatobacter oligotrophus]